MPVTLIIVNGNDIASVVQARALLEKGNWEKGDLVENCETWHLEEVYLWWLGGNVLFENNLDKRWSNETNIIPDEIIFPSRHSSKSGIPSLTLHYIGVPHLSSSENPPFGGKPGKAPPPNPRLAAWFRLLNKKYHQSQIGRDFELTLETTHHGPWLETPSMYIEIGSDAKEWGRIDAAQILADVIWEGLGLDGTLGKGCWSNSKPSSNQVIICLGGGHYAPRHTSLALNDDVWLGHLLANYSLPMQKPDVEVTRDPLTWPKGNWIASIEEAISSTKMAYEGAKICAYLDRKSFKGWQRRAIVYFLESKDIFVGRTTDFV